MTFTRPMFPPPLAAKNCSSQEPFFQTTKPEVCEKTARPEVFPGGNGSDSEPFLKPVEAGRRGFLRGLAAFLPLTAAAAAIAPAAAVAPPAAENPELLRMGAEVDRLQAKFLAAVSDRELARGRCRALWPEVPEEIVYRRSQHHHLDYGQERDEDEKLVNWRGERQPPRLIIPAYSVRAFLDGADRRFRIVRETGKLLPLAERYEADRDLAMESSGYIAAARLARGNANEIDDLSTAMAACECRTFRGLALRAKAMLVAITAGGEVDQYLALRARTLHADIMARDIVRLSEVA